MITDIITRHTRRTATIFALAALVGSNILQAQTWTTVDDFQYTPSQSAFAHSLTADVAGNIYVTGWGTDAAGVDHGMVMAGADAGTTWTAIEDFSNSRFYDIGLNPSGNLFAVGVAANGPTWLVRKGVNNGASWSWSTADNFLARGYSLTSANGFAADSSGNLFVAGFAYQPGKRSTVISYWVVRKSSGTGQTWSTVDTFQYNGSSSMAHTVISTAAGLFVAGTGNGHWLVRQSTDSGLHWALVDDFQYPGGATAQWLARDPAGNLYAVGYGGGDQTGSSEHWLVRKGVANGTGWSWSTMDDFQYATGENSSAAKVGVDASGDVYVAGYGADSTGVSHWITRGYAGGLWETVDDFQFVSGKLSDGFAIGSDAVGNLYSAGAGRDSANEEHWLVRKSAP